MDLYLTTHIRVNVKQRKFMDLCPVNLTWTPTQTVYVIIFSQVLRIILKSMGLTEN